MLGLFSIGGIENIILLGFFGLMAIGTAVLIIVLLGYITRLLL